ncbi:MAG: UDP-glucose/GDP-mannose dehydrogenase family protein [Rhizobiaceae bacterium]|nr:UDP-glucose/GDP-mannose dehydrogenase family protein [Rhizobiaceae bacterium]
MKIVIVGAGYVGLVSGVCFSDFGHDVVCVEKDERKLEMLKKGDIPIYEPGLDVLLAKNIEAGRIHFTNDLTSAMVGAEAVFIAVGTPTRRGDGHADLTYVFQTAEGIADAMHPSIVVITKSTVPVGTNRKVAEIIKKRRPDIEFHTASNPEFLREGSAIEDFMRPDRVVIGVESEFAEEVLRRIYRPLNLRETPILATDMETAEIIKYAANAFLATKITFINEIANLCVKVGGDVQQVAQGIGIDKRIGARFLHAGPGYGGSCFPKDTLALARTGREVGAIQSIVETVIQSNEDRKAAMADKIIAACGGSVDGKRIAILGVTFKPNTDDMRDAPSLVIVPKLREAGAEIIICDPQGQSEGVELFPGVIWESDPYESATGTDAVVIITEWNAFRGLDLTRLKECMSGSVFVDLRNIYSFDEMAVVGLQYFPVGKRDGDAA